MPKHKRYIPVANNDLLNDCGRPENVSLWQALFGPDAPDRRCPLIGEERKFAARCQSDAIDLSGDPIGIEWDRDNLKLLDEFVRKLEDASLIS